MTMALERDARTTPAVNIWLAAALGVAILGLVGSLYASLGMNLKACPLCFYQRTFMMSLVAVLGLGLLAGLGHTGRLGALALPLALGGLGVAGFHVNLEMSGKLECPQGLFGVGSVPLQSFVAFALLAALLLLDGVTNARGSGGRWVMLALAVLVGAGLTVASVIANPPSPPTPEKPYAGTPDVCRPPYRAP